MEGPPDKAGRPQGVPTPPPGATREGAPLPPTTVAVHSADEPTLERLSKELDTYSDRISTQLRTVTLGVLGVTWLLLLKGEEVLAVSSRIPEKALLGIALSCVVALVVDLLQYLLAEKAVEDTFDRAGVSETRTAAYDRASWTYRAQLWCYRLKMFLTIGSAGTLVFFVGKALLS
jgi:hypothetical protein